MDLTVRSVTAKLAELSQSRMPRSININTRLAESEPNSFVITCSENNFLAAEQVCDLWRLPVVYPVE